MFDHPPFFVESADGAHFVDVDGHRYLDLYANITAASAGHTHAAVVAAVANRSGRGVQFGLPTEDSIAVSEALAARWGLPKWQFALSSSQANVDMIRLARIAIGGTMFGNALCMAATRAALAEVWTPENHERTQRLAARIADGMRAVFEQVGTDWNVYQLGNRAGFRFDPDPPHNNVEAAAKDIPAVRHLQRVYMANRGVWEFGWWCGPVVSAQVTDADVDFYLVVLSEFMTELIAAD